MTNLTLTQNNLWEVISELHSKFSTKWKKILLSYEIISDKKTDKSNFLNKFKDNGITLNEKPLSFQNNIRNEWK